MPPERSLSGKERFINEMEGFHKIIGMSVCRVLILQAMLRQYGGDVPEHLLEKLVGAFSELGAMADEGLIAYPYSTREVVAIVKHLQVL